MSHPVFISPSNSRLNRSSTGFSLPLCSTNTGDRHAQQALFMGCPTTNMVSFSPLGENVQHDFSSSEPSFIPAVAPPRPCRRPSLPYLRLGLHVSIYVLIRESRLLLLPYAKFDSYWVTNKFITTPDG
jgi:hypothetical protein